MFLKIKHRQSIKT